MNPKPPRPGAHNHIEGAPEASLDYVRELGAVDHREETRQALLDIFERENTRMGGATLDPVTESITVTFEVTHAHPEAVLGDILKRAGLPRKVVPSWQVVRDA